MRPLVLFDGSAELKANWQVSGAEFKTASGKHLMRTKDIRAWLCYNQPLKLLPTDIIRITTSRALYAGLRTMALTNYVDSTQGMGGTQSIAYYSDSGSLADYAMWYTKESAATVLEFVPKDVKEFGGNIVFSPNQAAEHDAFTIYIIQDLYKLNGVYDVTPTLNITNIEIVDSRTL